MTGNKISEEYRNLFDKACKLQSKGRDDEALDIFFRLEKKGGGPRSPLIGMIGTLLYYRKKDIEKALGYLFESRRLSPKSEKTSIALFHALLECGRDTEAFDEMRRFLSISESAEYQKLLIEINEE